MTNGKQADLKAEKIWGAIRSSLQEKGVDLDLCCKTEDGAKVKVVCVSPDLRESVDELTQCTRDQVLMVRVDESTIRDLDAWTRTGAVRSRSEAAALFVREGLKVRAAELEQLRDALQEVEEAQERLRSRAARIFKGSD